MTIDPSVLAEIEGMRGCPVAVLRDKYHDLFGYPSRSSNKPFLFRRIAWRLQARAEGDLSERARQRAQEIAQDADLRIRAPREFLNELTTSGDRRHRPRRRVVRDERLPPPGSRLTRNYRGQLIEVQVREDGFEYQARHYRSLSAIAREVTGTRWNGLLFFHLTERSDG
jgi:Protein of unknown function (DUF2924)